MYCLRIEQDSNNIITDRHCRYAVCIGLALGPQSPSPDINGIRVRACLQALQLRAGQAEAGQAGAALEADALQGLAHQSRLGQGLAAIDH
jgi:hypothetical protein